MKKINKIKSGDHYYLYQGLILLIIGLALIFLTATLVSMATTILATILIISGIGIIIYHLIFRPIGKYLFLSIFMIILGILLLWFLLPFLLGLFAFFYGVYKIRSYTVTKNFINLIEGVLSFALTLFMIFNPGTTGLILLKVIGVYLILNAIPILIYYFRLKNSRYVKIK